MKTFCTRCGSRLFPADRAYIRKHGVCSYCVTYMKQGKKDDIPKEETAK